MQSVFFVARARRAAGPIEREQECLIGPAIGADIDLAIMSVSNLRTEVLPVTQSKPTKVDSTNAKGSVGVGSFGSITNFLMPGGTFANVLADSCVSTHEMESRVLPPVAMEVALLANKAEMMMMYTNNVAALFIVLVIKDNIVTTRV